MPIMVDAMVLIHACAMALDTVKPHDKHWQRCRDCHHAIADADRIATSSIVWTQVRRTNDATRAVVLDSWLNEIIVFPVDARVAERAAALYLALGASQDVCAECFGLVPPQPCSKCGAQRSQNRATDDMLIAATADVAHDVERLYSFDRGVLHMNDLCNDVTITRPPKAPPEALSLPFPTPIETANEPKARRRKK